MATLAQRLNELATANTDGLLSDEEYRLLRQDVFERYSGNTPATTGRTRGLSSSSSSFPTSPKVIFQPLTPPSVSRAPSPSPSPSRPPTTPRKPVRSLTNLIRRATSSKPKKEPPLPPINNLKRAFKLSRKRSIDRDRDRDHDHNRDATSIRTSSSAGNSARTSGNTTIFSPPTSPTRMPTATSAIMGDDIFEDGGLSTTKELRQFIKQVEEEGKRVVQAFNELEQSAALRIDGPKPEWLLPNAHVVSHTRKSVSRNSSPSPLPRRKRKSSLSESSLSSQGTSMFSGRPSYSSTGHLPLAAGVSMDIDSDMANIQKRKADVMGRYEARLEYLRARLKGAELHEKLLKK